MVFVCKKNFGLPCIYFDTAKAFDTVSYRKLLFKLRYIGIFNKIVD